MTLKHTPSRVWRISGYGKTYNLRHETEQQCHNEYEYQVCVRVTTGFR
jgi:hypothetical protein